MVKKVIDYVNSMRIMLYYSTEAHALYYFLFEHKKLLSSLAIWLKSILSLQKLTIGPGQRNFMKGS